MEVRQKPSCLAQSGLFVSCRYLKAQLLRHLCGLAGFPWAALSAVGISALFSLLPYAQVGWYIPSSNESLLLWYGCRVNDYQLNTTSCLCQAAKRTEVGQSDSTNLGQGQN